MSFASPSTTNASSQDLVSNTDTGFLSSFIYSITSYNITIPLWLQITMIIIIIICLITGGYFAYDLFDISYTRKGFIWFIFIAFLNLITILMVLIYYNIKSTSTAYTGKSGRPGKKGAMGKKGSSVSCNFCANNIYLARVKYSELIGTLSIYTPDFKTINDNLTYFNNIISQGDIDYDSFVNGIILGKKIKPEQQDSIDKFKSLMQSNSIAIFLIENINSNITKSSDRTYGTFQSPGSVTGGYIPLGDSVYGGIEDFSLNSFLVSDSSDIMYPPSYNKLVTIKSYDEDTGDVQTFTLWRPNSNFSVVNGFKQTKDKEAPRNKVIYNNVGDICYVGTNQPPINNCVLINEKCLDPVHYKDLTLVFIYVGNNLQFNNDSIKIDYTQTDSYLINNNINITNIEIFSVWRTPLNTFLTNCNSNNKITNGTILQNMVGNFADALNDYGSVNSKAKKDVIKILQSINIPKILAASIICKSYELELHKELIYYYNKYYRKILELDFGVELEANKIISSSLGDLMNNISLLSDKCDKFNAKLIKNANIDLTTSSGTSYDSTLERNLPKELLKTYNSITTQLLTISVKIENANTFYDVINELFDNGIDTRVAYNSDGIAEGGILLNEIQETIVRICKMLMPPSDQQAYTIKDECLGTFSLDRDREKNINDFSLIKDEFEKVYEKILDKLSEIINKPIVGNINSDKNKSIQKNINNMKILKKNIIDNRNTTETTKVGLLCGYIEDYIIKINNMKLDEFTNTRIKGLKKIYSDMLSYYQNIYSDLQ